MDAYYNRREANGVVAFDVVPAPYPGGGLSNFGFLAGLVVTIISIPLIVVVVGIPMVLMGLWVMWMHAKNKKRITQEIASRQPFTVSVSGDGIDASSGHLSLSDLREIQVGHTQSGPSATQFVDVSTTAAQVGHNARLKVEAAQRHVSYQVLARMISDSRLRIIAAGLTEQTARALTEDVRLEVAKRREEAASA